MLTNTRKIEPGSTLYSTLYRGGGLKKAPAPEKKKQEKSRRRSNFFIPKRAWLGHFARIDEQPARKKCKEKRYKPNSEKENEGYFFIKSWLDNEKIFSKIIEKPNPAPHLGRGVGTRKDPTRGVGYPPSWEPITNNLEYSK